MRQFPAANADARNALQSALADDDELAEGEARRRLGTVAHMQGDLSTSRRELDAAVDIFRRAGDDKRLAHALRARGFAEVFGGSIPAARTYLGEAMSLFGTLGDERGQAWSATTWRGPPSRVATSPTPRRSSANRGDASTGSATASVVTGPRACSPT